MAYARSSDSVAGHRCDGDDAHLAALAVFLYWIYSEFLFGFKRSFAVSIPEATRLEATRASVLDVAIATSVIYCCGYLDDDLWLDA